ncbi:MAG TPA: AAA family ATPase [Jiangellales bacterium]|nr:AAA family ATPase [Jiangellales bacterium]
MVCQACGEWVDVPRVDEHKVVCPHCGHREPIVRPPTLFLTGASGTGKSSVARRLVSLVAPRVVVLEQDVLWVGALQDPTDEFGPFRRTWLRVVAMLNQSGRPSLLCGTVAPPEVEYRPERALLGPTHYLALVADDDVLRDRLAARPAWRGWQDDDRVAAMLRFNRWIVAHAAMTEPPISVLDTTHGTVEQTAQAVSEWVLSHCTEQQVSDTEL